MTYEPLNCIVHPNNKPLQSNIDNGCYFYCSADACLLRGPNRNRRVDAIEGWNALMGQLAKKVTPLEIGQPALEIGQRSRCKKCGRMPQVVTYVELDGSLRYRYKCSNDLEKCKTTQWYRTESEAQQTWNFYYSVCHENTKPEVGPCKRCGNNPQWYSRNNGKEFRYSCRQPECGWTEWYKDMEEAAAVWNALHTVKELPTIMLGDCRSCGHKPSLYRSDCGGWYAKCLVCKLESTRYSTAVEAANVWNSTYTVLLPQPCVCGKVPSFMRGENRYRYACSCLSSRTTQWHFKLYEALEQWNRLCAAGGQMQKLAGDLIWRTCDGCNAKPFLCSRTGGEHNNLQYRFECPTPGCGAHLHDGWWEEVSRAANFWNNERGAGIAPSICMGCCYDPKIRKTLTGTYFVECGRAYCYKTKQFPTRDAAVEYWDANYGIESLRDKAKQCKECGGEPMMKVSDETNRRVEIVCDRTPTHCTGRYTSAVDAVKYWQSKYGVDVEFWRETYSKTLNKCLCGKDAIIQQAVGGHWAGQYKVECLEYDCGQTPYYKDISKAVDVWNDSNKPKVDIGLPALSFSPCGACGQYPCIDRSDVGTTGFFAHCPDRHHKTAKYSNLNDVKYYWDKYYGKPHVHPPRPCKKCKSVPKIAYDESTGYKVVCPTRDCVHTRAERHCVSAIKAWNEVYAVPEPLFANELPKGTVVIGKPITNCKYCNIEPDLILHDKHFELRCPNNKPQPKAKQHEPKKCSCQLSSWSSLPDLRDKWEELHGRALPEGLSALVPCRWCGSHASVCVDVRSKPKPSFFITCAKHGCENTLRHPTQDGAMRCWNGMARLPATATLIAVNGDTEFHRLLREEMSRNDIRVDKGYEVWLQATYVLDEHCSYRRVDHYDMKLYTKSNTNVREYVLRPTLGRRVMPIINDAFGIVRDEVPRDAPVTIHFKLVDAK